MLIRIRKVYRRILGIRRIRNRYLLVLDNVI